jgi:hypothetical protein
VASHNWRSGRGLPSCLWPPHLPRSLILPPVGDHGLGCPQMAQLGRTSFVDLGPLVCGLRTLSDRRVTSQMCQKLTSRVFTSSARERAILKLPRPWFEQFEPVLCGSRNLLAASDLHCRVAGHQAPLSPARSKPARAYRQQQQQREPAVEQQRRTLAGQDRLCRNERCNWRLVQAQRAVFGSGTPCTPAEVRERMHIWIPARSISTRRPRTYQ